jgi:hypothetical protein
MFGSKRDGVKGELHALYISPNIIWAIKSRKMELVGHVSHKGVTRGAQEVLLGKL